MNRFNKYFLAFSILAINCGTAMAAITCPPMPVAVTTISKDVKSDINLTVGGLGKLKAGDLGVKTEVASKNLFDKYPNVDRLLALQMMAATYCQMLNSSSVPDADRLDRWEKFQDKVLELQTRTKAGPTKPSTPTIPPKPVSRLPTDKSVLTIPSEDCLATKLCPHPFAVAFSSSSDEIAYGTRNGEVRIWSISRRRELDRLSGLSGAIEDLAFDPSGQRLVGRSTQGAIVLWDIKSGKPLVQLEDPKELFANVAWTPRFDTIALAPLLGRVRIWKDGLKDTVEAGYAARAMDLSRDGTIVAANQFDGSIILHSASNGGQRLLKPASEGGYSHVKFAPSGQWLIAADGKGNLRRWDVSSGDLGFAKIIPGGGIRAVTICPDDSCIAAISLNGGVFVYDASGTLEAELKFMNRPGKSPWSGKEGNPWSIALSADSKLIAAGSVNGEVIVWELATKKRLHYWVGHLQEQIINLVFSPNGRYVATACFDGTVKIWKLSATLRG